MKKFVFAVAASALLAGCGSESSGSYETEDGETVDYTVDTSSGESTATIETDEGTATMRSGSNVEVDLPKGFSIYPGAKVVNNTIFDREGSKGAMVIMQSDADPADMVAFYRKQAETAGFKIAMEMKTDGSTMIAGEAADGEGGFSFSAGDQGGTTNAQLMVGDSFH